MKTEKLKFKSYNGTHMIAAWLMYDEDREIKGIIQIAHGMKEYFLRYNNFAEFLVRNGYVLCGNDHVGHGESLCGDLGFMGGGDVCDTLIYDMRTLFKTLKAKFPKAPYYMLGHSMGSFAVCIYASKWAYELNGIMLSGTGDYNLFRRLLYKGAVLLCGALEKLTGADRKIKAIESLIFKSFWKKFEPMKTKADWQTGDADIAQAFMDDPKCSFYFTLGGYKAAATASLRGSSSKWVRSLPKTMPVLIFSGDTDPAGDFGKGVKLLYKKLKQAGLKDVCLKLYEGGRHEMLNEICREDVYRDILEWLGK